MSAYLHSVLEDRICSRSIDIMGVRCTSRGIEEALQLAGTSRNLGHIRFAYLHIMRSEATNEVLENGRNHCPTPREYIYADTGTKSILHIR